MTKQPEKGTKPPEKSVQDPVQSDTETTSTLNESNPAHSSDDLNSKSPDPTRYGDWEKNGRCIDF